MRCLTILLAVSSTLLACGNQESTRDPTLTGETLTIQGHAALDDCDGCADPTDPTISYQTPSGLRIGVAEVALMRSQDDADPIQIFSAAPAKDTDLVAGATFCQVDVGSIPEGVYTHMRVKLDWMVYTVAATGHSTGYQAPGDLEVDYAISDYEDAEAGPRQQGDYVASFSAFGMEWPRAGNQPVDYPASHPGGTVDTSNGEYWVTFPTPQQPIVIAHDVPESVDVHVTYFIEDAFGWEEIDAPSYQLGVFDLSADPTLTEQPASMVIRGFSMEVCGPGTSC